METMMNRATEASHHRRLSGGRSIFRQLWFRFWLSNPMIKLAKSSLAICKSALTKCVVIKLESWVLISKTVVAVSDGSAAWETVKEKTHNIEEDKGLAAPYG
ncbi:hypothetical protein F2Q69_00030968 [Brassica cretica]|uniref:Uncharacterized protein n=1 Tax=Brassica cretica TaxID=69181 RepID=A0A8S9S409_BRACR|nr:hypothetical protein F2Q69_00030968 [Brassica cretica]